MTTLSLLQMRTSIRQRANMENSDFVTDAEINQLIVMEASELHDLLLGAYVNYGLTSVYTVVSGTDNRIALPGNFLQLRGINRDEGGGNYQPLKPAPFEEMNMRNVGSYGTFGNQVRYTLIDQYIYLSPPDNAAGTYEIWYHYGINPSVAADTDPFTFPENWQEYVLCGVTATLLAKEGSDYSYFAGKKAQMRARIEEMAQNRDASGAIQMVRKRNISDYNYYWDREDD